MAKDNSKNNFSELRQRALAFIAAEPEKADMSHADVRKLVHQLDTYQIELELQNEELRNVQEELDRFRRCYSDLYDFAPIGYLTLSDKGVGVEANLTAGNMLGVVRGQLLNRLFFVYLPIESFKNGQ